MTFMANPSTTRLRKIGALELQIILNTLCLSVIVFTRQSVYLTLILIHSEIIY